MLFGKGWHPITSALDIIHYGGQKTLAQLSNSSIPLSTLRNSNFVGYDWVEESTSGAGKTRYTFFNEQEEPIYETIMYADSYFPYAPTAINYYNGLPKQVDYFKGSQLLKSLEYTYNTSYSATIPGLIYNEVDNQLLWYGYKFAWMMKTQEVSRTFFTGTDGVEEGKSFAYNSNFQLSSIKSLVNGQWNEQKIKYATDFNDVASLAMVTKHMISVPIETIQLKDNLIVGGHKTTFIDSLGLILPKEIYSLRTPTPLNESNYQNYYYKVRDYDRYNDNGKVLQFREKGDFFSYLWGYRNYYPIAKLVNANYNEAIGLLDTQALQNLEENPTDLDITTSTNLIRNLLTNAQVTSYVHKPQVGLTSLTDERGVRSNFGYDIYNRLAHVKDYQGDLLKFYSYNYRGANNPYGLAESDLPGSSLVIDQFAWLDDPYGGYYPGKFRVTLVNTATAINYVFDIDENVKRFGGVPTGVYNISIVNLENRPISDFSLQLYGEEGPNGVLTSVNLDGGFNLFQILVKP